MHCVTLEVRGLNSEQSRVHLFPKYSFLFLCGLQEIYIWCQLYNTAEFFWVRLLHDMQECGLQPALVQFNVKTSNNVIFLTVSRRLWLAVMCSLCAHTPVWTWAFHSEWPWCTGRSPERQSYCGRTPWDVSAHSRVQLHRPQIYSGSTVGSTSGQLLEKKQKKTRGMRKVRYTSYMYNYKYHQNGNVIKNKCPNSRSCNCFDHFSAHCSACNMKWQITSRMILFLTVTFWPILQTESDGQHGIIFKELCSKRIPPQVVALLLGKEEGKDQVTPLLNCFSVWKLHVAVCAYEPLSSSVAVCWVQIFCSLSGCHMVCASWMGGGKKQDMGWEL